jgi:hypothetical protein
MFNREQRNGNTAAAMGVWRAHWDHQLYKTLDVQVGSITIVFVSHY